MVYIRPETPDDQLQMNAYMSWRQDVAARGYQTGDIFQKDCTYSDPEEVRYPFGGKQYRITVTGWVYK